MTKGGESMKLQTQKTALVLGVFLGGFHLVWSLFVLLGFAQPLLDFIFWAHMVANPYHVTGFTLIQTATLVVVTFGVGYLMGWVFAKMWNYFHK